MPSENGMKLTSAETKVMETLWRAVLINKVDLTRCSSLVKLCGVVGYVHRAVKKRLACIGAASMPAMLEAVLTVNSKQHSKTCAWPPKRDLYFL